MFVCVGGLVGCIVDGCDDDVFGWCFGYCLLYDCVYVVVGVVCVGVGWQCCGECEFGVQYYVRVWRVDYCWFFIWVFCGM